MARKLRLESEGGVYHRWLGANMHEVSRKVSEEMRLPDPVLIREIALTPNPKARPRSSVPDTTQIYTEVTIHQLREVHARTRPHGRRATATPPLGLPAMPLAALLSA